MMIESFKHLEEVATDRDLADVFLQSDEQEHAIPAEQILEALRKRRAVMRDCVERGKDAFMEVDVDSPLSREALRRICSLADVADARYLDRIP